MKFLVDENISSSTAAFLVEKGHDVLELSGSELQGISDQKIIELAAKEKRVILTHDLDFGEMYYFREKPVFGIIVLRIEPQTPEEVNRVLASFLSETEEKLDDLSDALIVVEKSKYRIRKR